MTLLLALMLSAIMPAGPLDAPVERVTVFGDRAQVVRVAHVPLPRPAQLRFPALPQTVDPDSIRVEAEGAEVQRVEIADLPTEAFPIGRAKKLLAQLEALDDQLAQGRAKAQALRTALNLLAAAVPATGPLPPPQGERQPLIRFDPKGWSSAQALVRSQSVTLRNRLREAEEQQRVLGEERARVAEEARLLGATERPHGTEVTAVVGAARAGTATLTLSYEVAQAGWKPVYDVQLDSVRSRVRLALAGLVSQTTGEDWTDASLVLSAAVPATSRTFPELPVWKIGERERFIPTPFPHLLPTAPPPNAPPLPQGTSDADVLRDELRARVKSAVGGDEEREAKADRAELAGRGYLARPRASPMMAPPPPPEPAPAAGAAPPAPMDEAAPVAAAIEVNELSVAGGALARKAEAPSTALPLGPPAGYRPPTVAPDAPAALAGGYDLSYPALRRETVPSGQGTRRIALFSREWPVSVTREVFPALAEAAFLVAELANPSREPLPGGHAELSVGDDPAGEAQLPLAAPGEKFTLPLGIDRAIKPVRRVELVQAERGFLSKDDVREYKVTVEIANPYPREITLHVVDQWPVTSDAHVKISLDHVEPHAEQESLKGELDWHLTLPASSKRTLGYSFTVTCPRGWQVYQ